jgi:uncharacterized phage-associated protein
VGGRADFHKIFKILYFADQKHVKKMGRPIFQDDYIKMPYGPVPSTAYDLLKALRGQGKLADLRPFLTPFLTLEKNFHVLPNQITFDADQFSEVELGCLDEAIEENKNLSFGVLSDKSHDEAWNKAADNGVISLGLIAGSTGLAPEQIAYVEELVEVREHFAKFNERTPQKGSVEAE